MRESFQPYSSPLIDSPSKSSLTHCYNYLFFILSPFPISFQQPLSELARNFTVRNCPAGFAPHGA